MQFADDMDNTNIFKHSPKELVTDAFITWLLYFLNSKSDLKDDADEFYQNFLIKQEDRNTTIEFISVDKQVKGKHGRPDLIVNISIDGVREKILFENKTWSTTSGSQLSGYRKDYGDIYRYYYLKLAYININEKLLCEKYGYEIITSNDVFMLIKGLSCYHSNIEQYAEFIKYTFVDKEKRLKDNLENDNPKILKDAQGQQIFISQLYEKIKDRCDAKLKFKNGTSAGRPWTELDFCHRKIKYKKGDILKSATETIFWRIDSRAGKSYVRLNQYSWKPEKEYLPLKKERLKKLRIIAKEVCKDFPELKQGKLSNRGQAECEIVIFFEDKNSIPVLLKVLPKYSKTFIEKYEKLM